MTTHSSIRRLGPFTPANRGLIPPRLLPSRALLRSTLTLLLASLQIFPVFAWVFPEHRDIVVNAVQQLDSAHQARLQSLWSEARTAHEPRLCASPADPTQVSHPTCVDLS